MDSERFEKYIEQFGRDVYSFCLYLTRNKEDADDLYQQTFLVAFEKNEIEEDGNPKSYLITIASNIWNNVKRKRARREKNFGTACLDDEEVELLENTNISVEDEVISKEEKDKLRRLVMALPDKFRTVILMYYMEEMSIDDIASVLRIPAGTVKSRMNKARKILKEKMDYDR